MQVASVAVNSMSQEYPQNNNMLDSNTEIIESNEKIDTVSIVVYFFCGFAILVGIFIACISSSNPYFLMSGGILMGIGFVGAMIYTVVTGLSDNK